MTDDDMPTSDWHARRHSALIKDALNLLVSPEMDGLARFRGGLTLYLLERIETGGFLRCVLENDLIAAMAHAHPSVTVTDMRQLTLLIRSSFPAEAWGSKEKVETWLHPHILRD